MTTQNQNLVTILNGIGLSKNEALIYLATLELGPSSIWEIAKKSGVKRPTCYVILDELIWKGYASKSSDGKRAIYSVSSPRELHRAIDRRHNKYFAAISELETIASQSPHKPIIRTYEGAEGVKRVYDLTLELPKGDTIYTFGTSAVEVHYGEFIAEYIGARVKKGIESKAILPDTSENRLVGLRDKAELRQTRFLPPDKYPQTTEVNIFGSTIAYIAHSEKNPFASVVENPTLAKEEKARFILLWEIAK
jgi:sugar-specific transcriptional regulator TrmB